MGLHIVGNPMLTDRTAVLVTQHALERPRTRN